VTNCISVISLLDFRTSAVATSVRWRMVKRMRRATLDGAGEDVLRLGETVASVEQAIDRHAVARPYFGLEEVALIHIERVARFLVRPVAHGHGSSLP
jgi:hypothetical protein